MADSGAEKKLKDVFSKIGKAVQTQAEIAKLRLQVKKLEKQKNEIFQRIGEKVYALFPKGLVKNSTLIALCEEVSKIDQEISEKLQAIEALKEVQGETETTDLGEEEQGIEEETEE
ncbi:hypothetical protein H5T87_00620 [bacterium]|nr:hypothetical protein [bacterium]